MPRRIDDSLASTYLAMKAICTLLFRLTDRHHPRRGWSALCLESVYQRTQRGRRLTATGVIEMAALKPRTPIVEDLNQSAGSYVVGNVAFQQIAQAGPGDDCGCGEVAVIADKGA